jgi:hypothetical protein
VKSPRILASHLAPLALAGPNLEALYRREQTRLFHYTQLDQERQLIPICDHSRATLPSLTSASRTPAIGGVRVVSAELLFGFYSEEGTSSRAMAYEGLRSVRGFAVW